MNIVFSGSYIQSNLFSALLCILLPVLFLWYYKKKTAVGLSPFFIGAAFSLLFSYIVTYVWNLLVLSSTGLRNLLSSQNHPVYSAIYGACSIGLIATLGIFIGLKYALKNRPGKENALVFGAGMGGFECILNGGVVYITNLIAAVLINSIGSEEYFSKLGLTGEELLENQTLFADQAAIPGYLFLMDATYLILSMVLCASVTVFLYRGLHDENRRFLVPVAFVLHILGYIPVYLTNLPALQNSLILLSTMIVYTFGVAFCAYRTYYI